MPKIVILGSCKYEPYEILAVPEKTPLWNTEEGYRMAAKKFYPAISEADVVLVWAPNGPARLGEHTRRDVMYALYKGKKIVYIQVRKDE